MTFMNIDRRLLMRYEEANNFTFNKIMNAASDQGVFNLATALASLQDEQPSRISTIVTRQMIV